MNAEGTELDGQVPVPSAREGGASVFTWSPGARPHRVRQVSPRGVTQIHVHPSEEAMLLAWLQWLREADPDILNVFQVHLQISQLQLSYLSYIRDLLDTVQLHWMNLNYMMAVHVMLTLDQ
jgi:DNA polymerase elongation subunit (family B)